MAISAQDVQAAYAAAGMPAPSASDIQYWTQTYAQTPDVVYSPNPSQQVVNAILASAPDVYDYGQFNYLTGGANLAGTTGINIPQLTQPTTTGGGTTTTNTGATAPVAPAPVAPAAPATPTYQGATRDQIIGLYRSIGLPDPAETDIAWWQNFSRTDPDVVGASNPLTQLTSAFTAAARPDLTPSALPTTGETKIDPAIAPYLTEALGVARNLFLEGPGPSLYPGQTYVSPSAATLDALAAAETLARSPTATNLGADVLSAYSGGLSTLSDLASPDYMQSQAYKDYVESVTRPVTEAVTEQILPAIASQYSAAGRYGSGAMAGATGMATERGARAVGDITSQIAQRERQNQFSAATALPSFLGGLPSVFGGALAPSTALAGVGAQREAIAAQPLSEAIRRYEYTQNLPYNQLSGYLSSIYGSPLGNLAQPNVQSNTALQNLGALVGIGAGVGAISETPFGSFLGGMFT